MKANELKVTDLKVGDWVDVYHELTDESGFYKPLRVTGIHYNDGICFGDSTIESPWNDLKEFEEGVRPILLTPEILEKNGFEKDELIESYNHYCGMDNRVSLNDDFYYINSRNTWYVHVDSEDYSTIANCELTYVHQLQHILRLCGIDKEIVV